ncbi:MAG: Phospho-N-acetylmuramoyl-pentapeptide-transferase [Firmicutes bacterium ADurb.Bin248]|nr:MAG: Phospho-N-acetylmuramoyl-pentapeptide-transferase [Firmicutes bacterium ADurb.Bin248]HOG01820.1 phospho-N-acetylmuramoyl-pentapeptide-transferase [Clostridia bacterium]
MKNILFAFLVSAGVTMALGPVLIPMLHRLKFGQSERSDGPQSHLKKAGTPTMGGMMFIAGILIGTLAFTLKATELVLPALLVTVGFALVGFFDDFLKVKYRNTVGLRPYQKIIAQFAIALIIALYAYNSPFIGPKLYLAFFDVEWDLGLFYIPFVMFVVIAIVNAVNLEDGIDGLASGTSLVVAITLCVIYLYMSAAVKQPSDAGQAGQTQYAAELNSMAIFAAAVAGGCLGFLRYNSYPARIIMGDTGSFALGGALAMLSVFSRSVLLFPIMGACFVASAASSIIQVGYFKLTHGKRVFKMAPLHHHFELKGVPETRIVAVYMIVTVFLCLLCLLAYV